MTTEQLNLSQVDSVSADTYPKILTCPNCDITFIVAKKKKGKPQKFCSPKCTSAFHVAALEKIRQAGKAFLASQVSQNSTI
jgi:hypothetical protein